MTRGEIEFINVEMRYSSSLPPALNNLSFRIYPSQKISVVGRTGSGKSTFFQLLQLFRLPTEGDILIDGVSVRLLDPQQLRKNLCVVLQ